VCISPLAPPNALLSFACSSLHVRCDWGALLLATENSSASARTHTHTHTHTHTPKIECVWKWPQTTEDQVCVTPTTVQRGSCDQLTLTRLLRCGRRCLPCALNAHRSCNHTFTCGSEQGAHQKPAHNHTHHNTRVCLPTQHTQPLSPPPLLCNPTQSNGGIMATAKKDRSRVVMNLSKDDVVRRDDAGLVCSCVLVGL
jgi:hypothetical protein